MASFKQHTAGGVIWGVTGSVIAAMTISVNIVQLVTMFILGVFAAILPDIDSDTSRPVEILFGIIAVLLPVTLCNIFFPNGTTMENMLCFIFIAYLVISHLCSKIFFKITKHRGIVHSIPAAIICGEVAFLIFADSPFRIRIAYALILCGGFLVHLIMDEIWSIDLLGARLKKSFGSALKFRSESKIITFIIYLIIMIMAIIIFSTMTDYKANSNESEIGHSTETTTQLS
jgi:membrane-bound metal-dependent hydrolase YbcI (DUF457 family)